MAFLIESLLGDSLPIELHSETVRLPDGRRLGVTQSGDLNGYPVFSFHGFGASRLSAHPNEVIARSLGVRLVAVDRPGIGLSDRWKGRRLLDWARDVAGLASLLGIQRFALLGCSTGGPHALACAACLPEQVTAVALAGSAGPLSGPEVKTLLPSEWRRLSAAARWAPWLLRLYFQQYGQQVKRDPQGVMDRMLAEMPEADRQLASQQDFYTSILTSTVEAFSHGGGGMLDDISALLRAWGFRLDALRQPVYLWHGLNDSTWPPTVGKFLASKLPLCQAQFCPGEGSLLYLRHWEEILQTLRQAAA